MTKRHFQLLETLRDDILSGQLKPGELLPDRQHLRADYGVSLNTIQRAMDVLRDDGFIEARPRAGTRVVPHPPHLNTIALVWHKEYTWSKFITAIRQSVESLAIESDLQFREYAIATSIGSCETASRLVADAEAHRIGGIVFLTPPSAFMDTAVLDDVSIPRVGVTESWGYAVVAPDGTGFRERAMAHLMATGKRRIAHLQADAEHVDPSDLPVWLRRFDLPQRPYWVQTLPSTPGRGFRAAGGVVDLLMQLPPSERPEALVIHDDNMIEPVVAALTGSAVRVPHDLTIVAHANFPVSSPSLLPVTRLGYDCGELVRHSVRIIQDQRLGRKTGSKSVALPAMFESEYLAAQHKEMAHI